MWEAGKDAGSGQETKNLPSQALWKCHTHSNGYPHIYINE